MLVVFSFESWVEAVSQRTQPVAFYFILSEKPFLSLSDIRSSHIFIDLNNPNHSGLD